MEKSATNVKDRFCNQMFRSRIGQRRLNQHGFLAGGSMIAPRWSHSPGSGIGQIAHQPRPKSGIATRIRTAHQAIQTKTMPKFRFPTGVPKKPARMAKRKPASITNQARNCGQRFLSRDLTSGKRVSSKRISQFVPWGDSDLRPEWQVLPGWSDRWLARARYSVQPGFCRS